MCAHRHKHTPYILLCLVTIIYIFFLPTILHLSKYNSIKFVLHADSTHLYCSIFVYLYFNTRLMFYSSNLLQ
jgi:hypothetical protein